MIIISANRIITSANERMIIQNHAPCIFRFLQILAIKKGRMIAKTVKIKTFNPFCNINKYSPFYFISKKLFILIIRGKSQAKNAIIQKTKTTNKTWLMMFKKTEEGSLSPVFLINDRLTKTDTTPKTTQMAKKTKAKMPGRVIGSSFQNYLSNPNF